MSLKKTKMPTQLEIYNLIAQMTMDQIRATDTFRDMPTRFKFRGVEIPKSALRRNDLAKAYLMSGGKIVPQEQKPLKHYRPSTYKKTSLEKKHDRYKENQTKDHKGNVTQLRHTVEKKQSLKRPAPRPRTNDSTTLPKNIRVERNDFAYQDASSSDDTDTDRLTDDLLSWKLDEKRQRVSTPAQKNKDNKTESDSDDDIDDAF